METESMKAERDARDAKVRHYIDLIERMKRGPVGIDPEMTEAFRDEHFRLMVVGAMCELSEKAKLGEAVQRIGLAFRGR